MKILRWFNIIGIIGAVCLIIFLIDVGLMDTMSCCSVVDVFIPNLISALLGVASMPLLFLWMGASIEHERKN